MSEALPGSGDQTDGPPLRSPPLTPGLRALRSRILLLSHCEAARCFLTSILMCI